MCFSALVKQNLKQLSFQFNARIDYNAFEDLFRLRAEGEPLTISRALEFNFTHDPKTPEEKRIAKLIKAWRKSADAKDQAEIEKQSTRLEGAIEKLKTKETKKALEDKRISTEKIEKLTKRIERRNSDELGSSDGRIWPFWYAPMVYSVGGETVIAPFRYHLRPANKDESFDQERDGCYNAREDSLETVSWWKAVFFKKHALMVVLRFYENVQESAFHKLKLRVAEKPRNLVVSFDPGKDREMLVPMIYDCWKKKGCVPVNGAAAITFEPTPEVLAAGHDRTIGRLKSANVEHYLCPESVSKQELWALLRDHDIYHFKAEEAA